MLYRFALPLALLAAPLAAEPVAPAPTEAPAPSPALEKAGEGVAAVLKGTTPAEEVFAPQFLAAVSPTQLKALVDQIAAQFGPFEGLEKVTAAAPDRGTIALRFEKAIYSGPFAVQPDGKVGGLLLNDYKPLGDDSAAIERDLAALPGKVSVLYAPLDGGTPRIAVNADQQFAIGSTFKLYVLAMLARQVEAGMRRWEDVVRIDDVRSLPSGQMQDWPKNAPVTLQTLATMMISISDNTATDQLIHLLGRETLAEEVRDSGHSAPDRMLPLLTTREMFALKADAGRGSAYAAAPEAQQHVALEALAQEITADPSAITAPAFTSPTLIDGVEWFASAEDLRKVLRQIAQLKDPTARNILAVSPSIPAARRKDWAYAGYKGGSEPGVLNLTWLLQKPDGAWWVLAMSWNDPAKLVDSAPLEILAQRILALP
jgi:beta-lactamase class A